MALHPDDPPVSPLKGIGRIFTNAAAIRKALSLSASPSHGLTFCQGTYTSMGENIFELIEEFGAEKKIFFVLPLVGYGFTKTLAHPSTACSSF